MLSIQTNVNSLTAQQNLNVNNQFMSQTIQQLTSGYRINSSGDDAAGLAVANQLRDNVAQVTQGVSNGNDGVAQLQIMDGGISNISQILDRLQSLATQSASSSFTGDRTTLNNEFQTDIQEINRQAQAIGLNTGGTFASNLAVYLGGGSGTSAAGTLTNGTVAVNLSNSTVDAQSLGLSAVQATGANYDLGLSSASSVNAVLNNAANVAGEANAGTTLFNFSGPGFTGTSVAVNLAGVTGTAGNGSAADIDNLVSNINAALAAAGQGNTAAEQAFAAAGIKASVVTNANGGQQLAFTSSKAAFSVTAGDLTSNALMGNFDATAGAPQGSATFATQVAGGSNTLATAGTGGAANTKADLTWQKAITIGTTQTVTINAGSQNSVTVNLTAANTTSLATTLTAINQALQNSGNSTLQQIAAVSTGAATFNFISTVPGFSVSVGSDAQDTTALEGVTSAEMATVATTGGSNAAPQAIGAAMTGLQVGTGSTADISTLSGATSAVSAVSSAVQALGSAQAAIGKGEDQLNYAINLATSQITNYSAAESQIRDADIAQQAANLTKAQTLQQASIAAMAQANSAPQAVLSLLKG